MKRVINLKKNQYIDYIDRERGGKGVVVGKGWAGWFEMRGEKTCKLGRPWKCKEKEYHLKGLESCEMHL